MKMIFFFCFLLTFAFAQTRPTGGTGPKIDSDLSISQTLGPLDLLISERVKQNYDKCGLAISRPENFNIYQVYVTIMTLKVLNSIQDLQIHKNSYKQDCGINSIPMIIEMSCLFEGTDQNLSLFVTNPYSVKYLENEYHLQPEEAKRMMNVFLNIFLSLKDVHSIK